MIFDITPFRSDKNIGRAYNERIERLPENSVIILRDGDCMYLTPDYGNIIQEYVDKYLDEYPLMTCLTNRVGLPELCYQGQFSNDFNIHNHIEIAKNLKNNKIDIIFTDIAAGYFMMFRKSLWKEYGGFPENFALACDMSISKYCNSMKYKIGLMLKLYVFHSYRIPHKDRIEARLDYKHLVR